jgi:hypothetical protein
VDALVRSSISAEPTAAIAQPAPAQSPPAAIAPAIPAAAATALHYSAAAQPPTLTAAAPALSLRQMLQVGESVLAR